MKTDLSKVLSISGQPGLFYYINHLRTGVLVESIVDKKRQNFSLSNKITALADISIYTDDEEMKLQEVFLKLKETLGDTEAPTSKAAKEELVALFEKAVPSYDRDRFYVSHMKKVVDWYNILLKYASLDFVNPEDETASDNN